MSSNFMEYWAKRKVDLRKNHGVDDKTMKLLFVETILAWTKGKPLEEDEKIDVEFLLKEIETPPKNGLLGKFFG